MVSTVGANLPLTATPAASDRVLADDDVAALFGLDMAEPATAKRDLVTADGAEAVADKAKSRAKPAQAASPAKAKTRTVAASGEPPTDRKSPRATQPVATSSARTSRKAKSPSDKPSVERICAAGPKAETVVEGDAHPQRKGRHATTAQPGRTRAAKWIGARARRMGA